MRAVCKATNPRDAAITHRQEALTGVAGAGDDGRVGNLVEKPSGQVSV